MTIEKNSSEVDSALSFYPSDRQQVRRNGYIFFIMCSNVVSCPFCYPTLYHCIPRPKTIKEFWPVH